MSRIAINRKKIKVNLIIKVFLIALVLVFIFIAFFWLYSNNIKLNVLSNYIESFSKKYDYILTEIEISGLNNVSEIEINQHFKKYNNKSIFLVPIIEISKKIEKNSWIESIILKNNFKNKISIFIKEFKPIGIYFNGESYLLINKLGYVIDFANKNEILKYIIFEGQESITKAPNLIIAIPKELKSKIIRAQYINNRRWDIYTKENLRIQLPEAGYEKAMSIFIDIYADLYSSDITNIEYIDLRMAEKAIIKFYNEKK